MLQANSFLYAREKGLATTLITNTTKVWSSLEIFLEEIRPKLFILLSNSILDISTRPCLRMGSFHFSRAIAGFAVRKKKKTPFAQLGHMVSRKRQPSRFAGAVNSPLSKVDNQLTSTSIWLNKNDRQVSAMQNYR